MALFSYKEIAKLNVDNPKAFLVETTGPGIDEYHIMVKNEKGTIPYRNPTVDEMGNIAERMRALGANSF